MPETPSNEVCQYTPIVKYSHQYLNCIPPFGGMGCTIGENRTIPYNIKSYLSLMSYD